MQHVPCTSQILASHKCTHHRFLPATNVHTATHSNIEYDQAEPSGWLETYLRLTSTQNTVTVTMGLWALSP